MIKLSKKPLSRENYPSFKSPEHEIETSKSEICKYRNALPTAEYLDNRRKISPSIWQRGVVSNNCNWTWVCEIPWRIAINNLIRKYQVRVGIKYESGQRKGFFLLLFRIQGKRINICLSPTCFVQLLVRIIPCSVNCTLISKIKFKHKWVVGLRDQTWWRGGTGFTGSAETKSTEWKFKIFSVLSVRRL